jgi:hypothetical protein
MKGNFDTRLIDLGGHSIIYDVILSHFSATPRPGVVDLQLDRLGETQRPGSGSLST